MKLREASPVDFGFIRSIARKPEHALHVTDEDDAALRTYHTSSDCRLLICETGENHPAGFALFCDIHARSRTVELRRLALDTVGLGRGGDFLNLLMGSGFDRLGAGRLWLETGDTNPARAAGLCARQVHAGRTLADARSLCAAGSQL